MNAKTNKTSENKSRIEEKNLAITNNSSVVQLKTTHDLNKTGLPDSLKSGIENLSGFFMDHVTVHYNSEKPAQLKAQAYAQGADIHLGSEQEKHLLQEAWHVVQQKQGRVKPNMQIKDKTIIKEDKNLENEADVIGLRAQKQSDSDSTPS